MRSCEVIRITENEIVAKVLNVGNEVSIPLTTLDPFHRLVVGTTFNIDENDKVEYQYSLRRRNDIREHHLEEARNGDI